MPLSNYNYEVLEGDEADDGEVAIATQKAINGGVAWKFQGSVGRSLMDAISAGAALLGVNPASDYYGNYIPSRTDVKAGTKGSYEFVVAQFGVDYADQLAAL